MISATHLRYIGAAPKKALRELQALRPRRQTGLAGWRTGVVGKREGVPSRGGSRVLLCSTVAGLSDNNSATCTAGCRIVNVDEDHFALTTADVGTSRALAMADDSTPQACGRRCCASGSSIVLTGRGGDIRPRGLPIGTIRSITRADRLYGGGFEVIPVLRVGARRLEEDLFTAVRAARS